LLSLFLPAAALAGGTDDMDSLLKDYGAISQSLYKAQQTQTALLKQKEAIDAQGVELVARQQGMNSETEVHSSIEVAEQKELDAKKDQCDKGSSGSGKGGPPHADGCGKGPKKLGKITLAASVSGTPQESRQTLLDLEFGQYTQSANDWTEQENRNVTAANALYRALNDWVDRADYYMRGASFQDAVQASHADKVCARNRLPEGTLSIEQLQLYAVDAEHCLHYVAVRRKPGA